MQRKLGNNAWEHMSFLSVEFKYLNELRTYIHVKQGIIYFNRNNAWQIKWHQKIFKSNMNYSLKLFKIWKIAIHINKTYVLACFDN